MNVRSFCALFFLTIFLSCGKDPVMPPSGPPTGTVERQMTLSYTPDDAPTKTVELIISDTSGNFLVDTIVPVKEKVTVRFKSNETKYNITTIEKLPFQRYRVYTYSQVSPKDWALNQKYSYAALATSAPAISNSTINYYNIPAYRPEMEFQMGNAYTGYYDGQLNILRVSYDVPNPYYSYLLIEPHRLYKFHETVTNNDSVDLSRMDTARAIVYKKDFQVTNSFVRLEGFRKKDDLSSFIRLYRTPFLDIDYDLLYPPTGVEQYALKYSATDENEQSYFLYMIGEKVPETLQFLRGSDYKLIKKADNDFEIQFLGALPTSYSYKVSDDVLTWEIQLPADKTRFQMNEKFVNLKKSRLLNSYNYSLAKPSSMMVMKANDYDFTTYLNTIFDPTAPSSPSKVVKYLTFTYKIP